MRVQARAALDALRDELEGKDDEVDVASLIGALAGRVDEQLRRRLGEPLRRVLNATGILIHTNLGRLPLDRPAVDKLAELAGGYCDLEMDLESADRGDRNRRCEEQLKELTGAAGAIVVNNNAAALLLALTALASGREVAVSRGELVEIGGSFRIAEILETTGARLRAVGSTNRTRLRDYEEALGPETGVLLRVLPSNFRQSGFVAEVAPSSLAELARRHHLPLLVDEGSGLLQPANVPPLRGHPSLQELALLGSTIACGSGDKLLGGPQCGLIVGPEGLLAPLRRHPLYRALRPDRLCLIALEATLRGLLGGRPPAYLRLWPEAASHRDRVERLAAVVEGEVVERNAFLGGGSAPEAGVPGPVLSLAGGADLASRLRRGRPPVLGYVRDDRLLLDLRTVNEEDDDALLAAWRRAAGE